MKASKQEPGRTFFSFFGHGTKKFFFFPGNPQTFE